MDLPLPRGTHLVHIGPQKTGTTSLQGAFHKNRMALAEHGVHYAGPTRQPRAAAAAVTLGKVLPGHPADSPDKWPALVKEVRGSTAERVVISAEMFANAEPAAARTIIDDIGGDHPHVVITLRPLARLLSSMWQQQVQGKLRLSYDEWLQAIFADTVTTSNARTFWRRHRQVSTSNARTFWRRHRHDALARRWADVVGADNVTAIVLDERDRNMTFRTFEQLLCLPTGILVPDDQNNRSLSLPEAEMLRELNRQYDQRGWPQALYARALKRMLVFLRERPLPPDEPRITTPTWAAERADDVAVKIQEGLAASGVNIIGDLANLRVPVTNSDATNEVETVPIDAAARAVIGAFEQTQIRPQEAFAHGPGAHVSADAPSTGQILRTVAGHVKTRVRTRRGQR